ncbi:MAG TPA: gluconate 2-dehydrogenase subunit 3 family protein [Pseudomonas sp.]|uniref:gluconate 2-dehydrogenase subunit 3 family protein n=1 Tax=Pseudomonas sp. TaxID=306 RepID=UPI002B4A64AF|nr:gluconate 2-dehydrogenase subunit 3 family protein [Pseudomonas sp.]HKS15629.1 gluconate 2-dehydrogenase subunit 3 family protein [Pseudomonas sp.]
MERRNVLKAGLVLIATSAAASIFRPAGAALRVLSGGNRWHAKETPPPSPVDPSKRMFLTDKEYAQVTAIFDRLIPADELSPSASQAGCVVFIDHQLAGPYGRGDARYRKGPEQMGSATQGDQSLRNAQELYRTGLAELDTYCIKQYGKSFETMFPDQQDALLELMESASMVLGTIPTAALFKVFLANVQEGFFADPLYGGNRDMVGWKMIGFPGARYDYRDVLSLKGQKIDLIPVSLIGRI